MGGWTGSRLFSRHSRCIGEASAWKHKRPRAALPEALELGVDSCPARAPPGVCNAWGPRPSPNAAGKILPADGFCTNKSVFKDEVWHRNNWSFHKLTVGLCLINPVKVNWEHAGMTELCYVFNTLMVMPFSAPQKSFSSWMAGFKNGIPHRTGTERKATSFPVFCIFGNYSNKNMNKHVLQNCLNI